jgi:carbon-monoxide dehydrogenase medium subunit
MLINLGVYYRPSSVDEAITLLRHGSPNTVALAGGTKLVASGRRDVEGVVDLRDLALSYVRVQAATLHIGSTTALQRLIDTPELKTFASGVLAETAQAVAGRNLRNVATIGGTVAVADGGDPLLTALLALDAKLNVYAPESRQLPIAGFLAYRERLLHDGALITEICLPLLVGPLGAAYVAVGRTPRDRPIVCAVARMELAKGIASNVRLALGGVAPLPARAIGAEQLLERKSFSAGRVEAAAETVTSGLEPAGDYLGGTEYRREMARVLARRALSEAGVRAWAMEKAGDVGDEGNVKDRTND